MAFPKDIRILKFSYVLAAVVLTATGCSDSPTNADPPPRAVETFEVQSESGPSETVYSGTLRARQRSDLSFLRSGQVVELRKDLGESFSRGEVLARLDSTELSFAVDELAATLLGAEAERADAQRIHDRLVVLGDSGAVSRAEIDTAIALLESATARVSSINAAISQARKRLTEMVLEAPYDGQVVERLVEPPQTAMAGQTVYRVIGDSGGLEAVVNLPVAALDLFVLGHRAEMAVRPSGITRSARVTEVGNAAGLSGLYPVTLALEDSSGLRPGLRVEVAARSEADSQAHISIPLTAYLSSPGTVGRVFLIDPATGRISGREVEIGAISDAGIEIRSGLEVGDLIVARGLPWLREGQVVAPLGSGVRRFNE